MSFSGASLIASSMSPTAVSSSLRPAVAFPFRICASTLRDSLSRTATARVFASSKRPAASSTCPAFNCTSVRFGSRSAARMYSGNAFLRSFVFSYDCASLKRASPSLGSMLMALRYSTIASANFWSAKYLSARAMLSPGVAFDEQAAAISDETSRARARREQSTGTPCPLSHNRHWTVACVTGSM